MIVCVCGRSAFNINVKLLLHVFSGEIMKQYNCLLCNREYKYASGLKRHISSKHLNERPFQCSYCDYSSTRKCILEQHEMRHTGERPHVCGLCGKGYIHEGALNSHINKEHLGIPSYTCHFCKEGFSNTASLESHVIRKHEPEKLLKCPGSDCSYVCVWKCHLISHIKRRHANKTEMIDFVNSLQTVRHFAPRTRSKVPSDNAQTMERVSSEQISSKSDELMIISDSDDLIPDHSATPDPKNCSMTKSDKGSNNSESNKNDISRSGSDETDGEKNLEPEVQKHSYQISPQLESPNLESATKSGKLSAEAIEAHHPRSDRKEYESVAITKAKKSRKYQKDSGDMEASKKEKANENGNPGHGVRDSVESMEVQLMNVDKVNAKSEVHLQDALEKIQVSSEQSKTDSDVEIISAESTTVTDSEKDKVIWCTFDSKSLNSEELPTMVDETKLSIEEPKDSGIVDSDRSESMTSKNEKLISQSSAQLANKILNPASQFAQSTDKAQTKDHGIESTAEPEESSVKTGKGYRIMESDAETRKRYRIKTSEKESNDVEPKKVKKKDKNKHSKERIDLDPSKQQKLISTSVKDKNGHGSQRISKPKVKTNRNACEICQKIYMSSKKLMKHKQKRHGMKSQSGTKGDGSKEKHPAPTQSKKAREDVVAKKKKKREKENIDQNVCDICKKKYKSDKKLMKHKQKRHGVKSQSGAKGEDYKRHKKHHSAHSKKAREDIVGKKKKGAKKGNENIDKASNECSICKKVFHSVKHVAWHRLTHATTPHKCHSCTATFQTKYHLREHQIKEHGCRDTLPNDYDVFNCSHSPKCANVKICFDKLLLSWKNLAV